MNVKLSQVSVLYTRHALIISHHKAGNVFVMMDIMVVVSGVLESMVTPTVTCASISMSAWKVFSSAKRVQAALTRLVHIHANVTLDSITLTSMALPHVLILMNVFFSITAVIQMPYV